MDIKADGSPVTRADREAEQFAREWLAERFPGDAVLGEEFGAAGASGAGRRWVIDPVDGTRSFVKGVPLWGTLVAVMEGDEVLAGAAAFPACGEWIAAARGEGAWWNGARARVSAASRARATRRCCTPARRSTTPRAAARWDALADRAGTVRTWGDCFGYLMVATGRAEVMMDPRLNVWDAASVHGDRRGGRRRVHRLDRRATPRGRRRHRDQRRAGGGGARGAVRGGLKRRSSSRVAARAVSFTERRVERRSNTETRMPRIPLPAADEYAPYYGRVHRADSRATTCSPRS